MPREGTAGGLHGRVGLPSRAGRALTSASVDAVVVGGGVIGLSTAVRLREAGLSVRVRTASPPHETTSIVAAALWYPYRAHPEGRVLGWGRRTFEELERLMRSPESGVRMREGVELFREPAPAPPWWKDAVPSVRRCGRDELPPGYRDGFAFSAPVVEMPAYLRYLVDRLAAAGGTVEERASSSSTARGWGRAGWRGTTRWRRSGARSCGCATRGSGASGSTRRIPRA